MRNVSRRLSKLEKRRPAIQRCFDFKAIQRQALKLIPGEIRSTIPLTEEGIPERMSSDHPAWPHWDAAFRKTSGEMSGVVLMGLDLYV